MGPLTIQPIGLVTVPFLSQFPVSASPLFTRLTLNMAKYIQKTQTNKTIRNEIFDALSNSPALEVEVDELMDVVLVVVVVIDAFVIVNGIGTVMITVTVCIPVAKKKK